MTDDIGMRKAARRRRATRRLRRSPARVPGDEVPRQTQVEAESGADDGAETDAEDEGHEEAEAVSDRRSADMIDVDLEFDSSSHTQSADGPTSGVMAALPRESAIAAQPVSGANAFVMPQSVAIHAPTDRPASASVLPPAPAAAAGSVPPPAPASVPAPAAVPRDSTPPDEKTNPKIRLADLEVRPSSLPPAPLKAGRESEPDEPTRPRIELSEMVMSAVRSSAPPAQARKSSPPPGEEPDVDTNPRIPVPADEDFSSVIVTRARIISDPPPAPETEAPAPPRRVVSVKLDAHAEVDELDSFDIDDEGSSPKLVLPAAPAVTPVMKEQRTVSKAPPPPPPVDNASKAPRAVPPMAASTSPMPPPAASQGPQPPAPAASQGPQPPAAGKAPPPPPPGAPKKPAPVVAAKAPKRRAWWEDFFSDDYLHSVITPTPAQIARQVDFVESSLGLAKGQTVLDVGCGLGLHALELARRGYLVVGLDLSLPMITRAAEAAQQEGLRINFLHTDLREIGFQGMFDAIVCLGTTFGFFDDEANRDVLARLCNSLKPGGKLLLDVVNRDHVINSQPNLVWFEGDGCVVMEESDFNYFTSRLVVKRTMMRDDGRQSEAEYSLRLYALHELGQMLQQAGFRVNEVSGQEATRGVFFGSCSTRIIMLAERRSKGAQNGSVVVAPPTGTDDPSKAS